MRVFSKKFGGEEFKIAGVKPSKKEKFQITNRVSDS
jgi:hypothetical protein